MHQKNVENKIRWQYFHTKEKAKKEKINETKNDNPKEVVQWCINGKSIIKFAFIAQSEKNSGQKNRSINGKAFAGRPHFLTMNYYCSIYT